MRDINPSSIFLFTLFRPPSIPTPFPLPSTCSRKLHRAQKIFILCRFRVLSKPSLMNTPPIKNWWSKAGRIVKGIPDVLDNVTVRSRVHWRARFASTFAYTHVQTYTCTYMHTQTRRYIESRGRIVDSYRILRQILDIKIAAWNVPHVFSGLKKLEGSCLVASSPRLITCTRSIQFVFGLRSFIFRSSNTAFDLPGWEQGLEVILLQWQSFA